MSRSRKNIISDGTSQIQRLAPLLDPNSFKLDEKKYQQILEFLLQQSSQINFYNKDHQIDGDWASLLPALSEIPQLIQKIERKENLDAHLGLIVVFAKLFQYFTDSYNQISQKHLQYFYQQILQFTTKPKEADQVHVIFELAKNVSDFLVEKGTLLKAGKSKEGLEQLYEVVKDTVINKTQIAQLKSLYVDRNDNFRVYIAPVANSADGLGQEFSQSDASWKPFGENQGNKASQQKTMVPASIGFALASPVLFLQEGQRNIRLTVDGTLPPNYLVDGRDDWTDAFDFYLSGEDDWIPVSAVATDSVLNDVAADPNNPINVSMTIALSLPPNAPAVVGFKPGIGGNFHTEFPVLKVLINAEKGNAILANVFQTTMPLNFLAFSDFLIQQFTINVSVSQMQSAQLSNDFGAVDASKPFLPFGVQPTSKSALIIGSAEVFLKSIAELNIFIEWHDIPQADLEVYYNEYFYTLPGGTINNPMVDNSAFTANLCLLYDGNWEPIDNNPVPIFDPDDAADDYSLRIGAGANASFTHNLPLVIADTFARPELSNYEIKNLHEFPDFGYFKIELNPTDNGTISPPKLSAFGHKEYARLYADIAILKTDPVNAGLIFPNQPYTPQIKSFSINYVSEETFEVQNTAGPEQFFHVSPFGAVEISNSDLLPRISPQYSEEGYLFIGLEKYLPPQQLSLLFQFQEGTGALDQRLKEEEVRWDFLRMDRWSKLGNLNIPSNNIKGFQSSGIVEVILGQKASTQHSLMPAGLHWLRVSARNNADGASRVLAIQSQAILARYLLAPQADQTENLSPNPTKHQIEGGKISKLQKNQTAIKKVHQPYPSFGGRGIESASSYYARVSERLRHKNKAISCWDYERIILEAFPSIYKVKCLNHFEGDDAFKPGKVQIIVIPNFRQQKDNIPLEPKVSTTTLLKIKTFIEDHITPSAEVQVANPRYERVFFDLRVKFRAGRDPGFYTRQLNEDIKKHLSPWAFEEGADIVFGSIIYQSDVLGYIENLDYVDFVTNFYMYSENACPGLEEMILEEDFIIRPLKTPGLEEMVLEENFIIGEPTIVAFSSDPRTILVSGEQHFINLIEDPDSICISNSNTGLGSMVLEIDFTISIN